MCSMSSRGVIVASHPPINQVMTDHPAELLHMDNVGPARVRLVGGKWYVLVIIDNFSFYSLGYFLETKDEVFYWFEIWF